MAKLADAQPSEGCDRKVMEVQVLSSAPFRQPDMKAALLVAILVAASASAQVLRPIDPNKSADVSGKAVDLPTVNFGNVSQPTRSQPVSPLSNQFREGDGIVETKSVETKDVEMSLLSHSTIPATIVPQQNFTAKRAPLASNVPPSERVKTPNAKINKREIRPFTPAGNDELVKQLREPH